MTRTQKVSFLLITLAILAMLILAHRGPVGDIPERIMVDDCAEDEACWDCSTMGNHICGPGKG